MADPAPILELIRKHESDGAVSVQRVASAYDVVWGGIPVENRPQNSRGRMLSGLTIGEVIEWQRWVVGRGSPSSAAGAYQFIRATLEGVRAQAGLSVDTVFSREVQDRLAVRLLDNRGWPAFSRGEMSAENFADRLAMEWASLPVVRDRKGAHGNVKRGQSFYAGDNLNRASATPDEVFDYLDAARGARSDDGVGDPTPQKGYAALEARIAALEAWQARVRGV